MLLSPLPVQELQHQLDIKQHGVVVVSALGCGSLRTIQGYF